VSVVKIVESARNSTTKN